MLGTLAAGRRRHLFSLTATPVAITTAAAAAGIETGRVQRGVRIVATRRTAHSLLLTRDRRALCGLRRARLSPLLPPVELGHGSGRLLVRTLSVRLGHPLLQQPLLRLPYPLAVLHAQVARGAQTQRGQVERVLAAQATRRRVCWLTARGVLDDHHGSSGHRRGGQRHRSGHLDGQNRRWPTQKRRQQTQ